MRGVFWFLGLFLLAVAGALLAHYNDGFALLVLHPWRVEMSLNLLALLLLAGFILSYFLLRGLLLTLGLPERARAYRAQRQREQVARVLEEAIRLLFEGRFGHALRRAESAWQAGHAPGTAALIAARAAQRMREEEKVGFWLGRAREASPESAAAALMLGAEMALEMGDYASARRDLQILQQSHGRHIAALRLELRALQGLGDVEGVLKLVRQLEKRGGLQPEPARAIRSKTHQEALRQRGGDAAALLDYFAALPAGEQDAPLVLATVRRLQALGADEAAASLIEQALAEGREWSTELAGIYGGLACQDGGGKALTGRIARAEAWLTEHPRDAALLLSLGRMCECLKLWGKARSYLEASLAVGPSRAAHLLLARLLDQLGETEVANRHFRLAAELETD